ncbi:DUF3592 domain-containing protein [Pseudomonas asiatica]|uniref:DUF3592 domain-containing protein n=1 Tax=Pseudomonas asiatica TaxID=2219225 RepID=UPI0018AA40A4|nr:DUF3592 domain-containing protein [Pseudomonas asiatica]GLO29052.1 hypothetical protein PPUN12996_11080 [Pseudomonas putida]MBF8806199.1 DUF3592 domain-containing protein [Pseudomonas asiatica]MBH3377111.1 DUF3592 domain-containing protein [Pseudomonas asiatica]MDD1982680.1 DUF3592 domain-containing protein [Pseudomonas asiatica]MDH0131783.1 DUF3592 domain-containing protein [Pseudomonas asiatica]
MGKTPAFSRGDILRASVFIPVGLFLLCLTFWLVEDRLGFVAHAQRAQGNVSAVNAGGSHPQIDFRDATGRVISYPENGLIFGYAIGDRVDVLYRPEAPATTAIIDDRGALWGASLLAGLFACVFALGGSYHLAAWIYRRRMAQLV